MKTMLSAASALFLLCTAAQAVSIDTNAWTGTVGPAIDRPAAPFTIPNPTSALLGSNNSGSLISDFTVAGDFTFQASILSQEITDDDVVGLLIGWSDPSNHIRVGFHYGQLGDTGSDGAFCSTDCLATGLWVVQEIAGVSSVLFEKDSFTALPTATYDLELTRTGGTLGFQLVGTDGTSESGSVTPTAPLSGALGVYAESQRALFSEIAVTTAPIPLPASVWLLALGLGGLMATKRRQRSAHKRAT